VNWYEKKNSFNLKDKVVNRAVNSLRKNKRIEQISFAAIAEELDVSIDDITSFYATTEDIFLQAQKKDWESLHRYWDKQIKKAKTPGDFKNAFEIFFERFVETLSKDADLRFELSCYLPECVKFRDKNRIKVKEKFTKLIKRGWPGKNEIVIQRQSELVTVLFYGFVDHIVHIPKNERSKILSDFRNMLNLHLQDRKFF
jgi:AcrR family transcriptional regulator|tara:strand:- start:140 stop:736 length:597 start_codon:yes stop_codon:yes gene_type:complete